MTDPIKLEPSNIRECWEEIKPYLEALKQKWPELATWRVEDVYAEVRMDTAVLYRVDEGFAVCTFETDDFTKKRDLFIWIAVSYEPGNDLIKKYLPSFIEVAKRLECVGVSTASKHPALATRMPVHYTQYRVAIDETT